MNTNELPEVIELLCKTKPMQRLSHIGMDCGCEYTSFPVYQNLPPYTRYMHSVGVASIVYRFTGDINQTVASLFHDIATPVFAHTIDFVNGDHIKQESTENMTEELIKTDREIGELLVKYNIAPDDVTDYHRYPVADNDSPALSADRLEYTLVNAVRYHVLTAERIREIYEDLYVSILPGTQELSFKTGELALDFAEAALKLGIIYQAKEDRYSMQTLADLIKDAVSAGVLSKQDLYTTEEEVIGKIKQNPEILIKWNRFRGLSRILPDGESHEGLTGLIIPAKKRYINPLIQGKIRATEYSETFNKAVAEYLALDQGGRIYAE